MYRFSSTSLIACVLAVGCEKASVPPAKSLAESPAASQKPASATASASPAAVSTNADGKIIERPGPKIEPVPAELPLPPGVTVLTSTRLGTNKVSRVVYGQLPEENDVSKVIQFFTDELPKHGWQVKPRAGEIVKGSKTLEFDKGTDAGTVSVYQKEGSAGTFVMVQTAESMK